MLDGGGRPSRGFRVVVEFEQLLAARGALRNEGWRGNGEQQQEEWQMHANGSRGKQRSVRGRHVFLRRAPSYGIPIRWVYAPGFNSAAAAVMSVA